MTVQDVQHILELWAPREIAWERDNVGLQVGNPQQLVNRILVALDATEDIVEEARRKKVELIITHHPLLFRPSKSITPGDRVGAVTIGLIRNKISLYATHTNLDFAKEGVSHALAERLSLHEIRVLEGSRDFFSKITVFVPTEYVGQVTEAMAEAGAGEIGKYDRCSFTVEGTGAFRARDGAKPFVGSIGKVETVGESRVEMIVPRWKVSSTIRAMREAHPYEEIAFDIYPLENESTEYGAGALGKLKQQMTLQSLLKVVKKALKIPALKFTGELKRKIETVAVCGGSGSDYITAAIRKGADAFITADLKYHDFETARGRIALIDAGHFETERWSLERIIHYLTTRPVFRKENIRVTMASTITNPVHYF